MISLAAVALQVVYVAELKVGDMVSVHGLGATDRHAPLWHRRRVMDTATRLLSTDRISVQGCSPAASRSMSPGGLPLDRPAPPGRRQGRLTY